MLKEGGNIFVKLSWEALLQSIKFCFGAKFCFGLMVR